MSGCDFGSHERDMAFWTKTVLKTSRISVIYFIQYKSNFKSAVCHRREWCDIQMIPGRLENVVEMA
jgi:hypothetical protein